jgi:hypothetical protein
MTGIEIGIAVGLGVVIVGMGVIIYHQLFPPTPPPPPPPPPAPPAPPAPPPAVQVIAHPERFTVQFVNPPASVHKRGTFRMQIVRSGTWLPNEVADFSHSRIDVEILPGADARIVSAIREMHLDQADANGNPLVVDSTYLSEDTTSRGALDVLVVSGGAEGADVLSASVSGSPNPPVTTAYTVSP